jgi:hypothetical protein
MICLHVLTAGNCVSLSLPGFMTALPQQPGLAGHITQNIASSFSWISYRHMQSMKPVITY